MYIAAAVAAAGTAADVSAQRQAAKERRGILNQAFQDTQKATDKATQLVAQEGAKYQGDQRMQDVLSREDAAYLQEQKDLAGAGAGGNMIDTAGDPGAVSGDFLRAKADKALSEGARMSAIARELAKTRAPGQLMTSEGLRRADVAQQTGSIFGTSQNMTNAAGLDAQSVTEPWWGTAGKLARTAAMAYMMGGAGGAASGVGEAGASYGLSGAELGNMAGDTAAVNGGLAFGDMAPSSSSFWGKAAKLGY